MSNKNWFHLFKRFFFPKTPDLHEEKSNKRRRWFFRRLKRSPPTLASHESNASFPAAEEEAAAVASAAAADPSQHIQHTEEPNPDFLGIRIRVCSSPFTHQHERNVKHLAAIKIQTAFRGYLARKALRALKGLVRLQAIIRGRAVRRQAMKTLKCLQSVVNIQSQVCARRCQMLHAKPRQEMMLKVGLDRERRWDDQLSTEDEANASILTKTEALLWRERLRAYSFNNHRCSTESEDDKADGIMRRWLERYVNAQVPTKDIIKRVDAKARKQVNLRQQCTKDSDPSMSFRRRSLQNNKRRSIGDDNLFPCSPMFPTYMAATESAKARLRSTSSPSLRPMVHSDAYSDGDSPYKHKLSPVSSINSDVTGKPICPQRRSLSIKGLSTPLGSCRILQDAGIESESLLLNRDCP